MKILDTVMIVVMAINSFFVGTNLIIGNYLAMTVNLAVTIFMALVLLWFGTKGWKDSF